MSRATPRPLLIFPCNGNGVEALDCVGSRHAVTAFIDDGEDKIGRERHGVPVLSRVALETYADAEVLAVPGSPESYRRRAEVIAGLRVAPARHAQVIHPSAQISALARVGRNVLIMAGVVVTATAAIGDHVCILPNSVVHHDAKIGDYAIVCSGVTIAGNVSVGRNCYIGSGTTVKNGVTIGEGALVGIGSNVVNDVAPGVVVRGNPAREQVRA